MGRKRSRTASDERSPGRSATMTSVAKELGVSPMTVSNAYGRPERVSEATRKRVFEAARRLGYAGPDPLGRGLRSGRAEAVGVVYDNLLSYAFADEAAVSFLWGLSAVVEGQGLGLTLVPGSPKGKRDASAIGGALVDGFVAYSVAADDPVLGAALERGLPAVIVDQPEVEGVPFVGIDDEAAARRAAEHLLGLGHERFGVVSFALSPDGYSGVADRSRQEAAAYPVSRSRLRGYAAALRAAGLPWVEVPVHECLTSSKDLGREAAGALLSGEPRPTAVLAMSDALALGVFEAARELGLRVPQDLSVVGLDGVREAAASTPRLTTVRQDHAEKGALAGRLLVARLRGEETEDRNLLPTRLLVQGSTDRPPE